MGGWIPTPSGYLSSDGLKSRRAAWPPKKELFVQEGEPLILFLSQDLCFTSCRMSPIP